MDNRFAPIPALLTALALLALPALTASPALAREQGPYSIEILVDGRPLEEYRARGTTYVEALKGKEYSVRLRNRTGRRVAVALSVDGLNSIDARTTSAGSASKWILGPHETITLDGWQTSSTAARRFFFTTEDKSYGEWLGKTDNLGVISAVFFRERRPRPAPIKKYDSPGSDSVPREPRQAAPSAGDAAGRAEKSRVRAEAESVAPLADDDYAATGIGREVDHRVRQVPVNAEDRPAAVLDIRYEYYDALVRLGVLPDLDDPLARRERARGFENEGFAPDPYRH